MPKISACERADLLALVRTEGFRVDKAISVEENTLNFAIKIYLFAKHGEPTNGKTHKPAG